MAGPRVLILLNTTARRGAELQGGALARSLQQRGVDVDLVALSSSEGLTTDVPPLSDGALGPTVLRRLRERARDADVVLAYGSRTLAACAASLAVSRTPFIYRGIGDPLSWARGRLHRMRTAALYSRASRVVVLWPGAAESVRRLYRVPTDRLSVIPNARDQGLFVPATADERQAARARLGLRDRPTVAYLGSLAPEKQVDRAITAAALLPEIELVVAGDGPERSSLERLTRLERISNVHFLGAVADPVSVMHAADVVVLSSRTEGMPGVVIEAGLCGLPSVTTDVGAVRELVQDGESGVILGDDSAHAIAAGLERALLAREEMGSRARAHMQSTFSWEHVTPQWQATLSEFAR